MDIIINALRKLTNNPIIKNMLMVGGVTIVLKLIGFYKETLVASMFGLSELLDTYYIAILIPSFIQSVFIASLKNLFIPNYITELSTTKDKGSFQSFTLLTITGIVIVFTISAVIFTEIFLETIFPGHDIPYYSLIRKQVYYVLPCLLIWGFTGFMNGLQEINNNYFASTISQIFLPVVTILCLVFFKDDFGDLVLVCGMLLGSISSFIFALSLSLYKNLIALAPIKMNDNMRIMIKQYPAKTTSGLLTGINPFVDQFFAAQLVVGSIAAMNYGIKIPAFVVGILILAIGNVLLPHFSRLINEDINKAYDQLFKVLKLIFAGSLIVSIIAIIFSDQIVSLLFERNAFTQDDTIVVSNIQKYALIYVPFYLCTLVCVKFLTAINKNAFMAWVSFWNLILNLILNMILVEKYGVYGLVISTTMVYIICSFFYVGFSYRLYKKKILN